MFNRGGVLCLKSQIPSTKLQINLKLQITNSKPVQRAAQVLALRERLFFLFGISNFGHWTLFDICDLIFVIFELPTNQIPTGDKTKPGPLDQDSLLNRGETLFYEHRTLNIE